MKATITRPRRRPPRAERPREPITGPRTRAQGAERPEWGLPTFHGVAYDTMADDPATAVDEAHMFEPHYDRHVWIYRGNPNGVFAPFNPNVTCRHHRNGVGHQHHASTR
jgi:hypothetical protein